MFAVLKTGGKQYRVQPGDVLRIERLAAEAGETVQFNEVLMLGGDSPLVGVPLIDGAAVQAMVIDQIKGDKVIHYVKRRRKHSSQRTKGHRQNLTLVRVTEILASGAGDTGVKAAIGSGKVKAEPQDEAAAATPAKAKKAKSEAAPKAETKAKPAAKATTEAKAKSEDKAKTAAKAEAKPKKTAAKKPAAEAQE